jgi:hypothetical protein
VLLHCYTGHWQTRHETAQAIMRLIKAAYGEKVEFYAVFKAGFSVALASLPIAVLLSAGHVVMLLANVVPCAVLLCARSFTRRLAEVGSAWLIFTSS